MFNKTCPGSKRAWLPLAMLSATALFLGGLSSVAAAQDGCTEAAQNGCTELSASPPQDTTAVPPNIVLILDDSGSMQWNYMPDSSYLTYETAYLRNAANNKVYYDPTVEYLPPPKADGSLYPSYTNIEKVPLDGLHLAYGNDNVTRHAGTQRHYSNSFSYYTTQSSGRSTYYYFTFAVGPINSSQTVYRIGPPGQTCGSLANCADADFVGPPFAPPGVRAGTNISNWFAYYRNRILMAKSGLMAAFVDLSPNYRFGFGAINNSNSGSLPSGRYSASAMTISNVRPFGDGASGTNKAQFWSWVASMDPSGGTPLRRALQSAGEYYETSQPWTTMEGDPNYVPGGRNNEKLACRASYTILTTDGFWNGSSPTDVAGATDSNGTTYTSVDGQSVRYNAVPPFSGGRVSRDASLADVAAYYWKRDLQGNVDNLVPTNESDEAFWQHMTTFTMGIGFDPVTKKNGPVLPMNDIFKWARDGGGTSSPYAIPGFTWPTPSSDNVTNIADMAHAAVVGRGDFFSAKSPKELADGFAKAIAQISQRNVASPPSSSNASVAVTGAISFKKSYNTSNWNGTLEAVELNEDGTTGPQVWDISGKLDAKATSDRKIFTAVSDDDTCSGDGRFDKGVAFTGTASFDCLQIKGLEMPALVATDSFDTRVNRVAYLRGDDTHEGAGYRTRDHRLGAIIHSDPLYVSYPAAGYRNIWPDPSPERTAENNGQGYDDFVTTHIEREGTVYVGANDGMLHAFASPAPDCKIDPDDSTRTQCTYDGSGGGERWAFVPRAVYPNLGNLVRSEDFSFRPTVDGTPRSRDVFINGAWRTLLVGGVGLGGRGVYALDVTNPDSFNANNVLWEFDADMQMDAGCRSNNGSCKSSDLGYTVPQPNIGRLANGKWVVLVSNGYFPDCSQPDVPTGEPETGAKPLCKAVADDAPDYAALFVLDAETGRVLAELKTPSIAGVKSYGLGPAVLGDYESDQIDDIAYAGDLMGNLWRFDLRDPSPGNWSVALAYKGVTGPNGEQGLQPITIMPRLFPDLRSNRFMVVFGTGKYQGAGDNSVNIPTQTIYGIQEQINTAGAPVAVSRTQLKSQKLTETSGARYLTDDPLTGSDYGWYIDLDVVEGERVVETPAAVFQTNMGIFRTLIPSNDNYCDPSTKGAVMAMASVNGGADGGLRGLDGAVGGRVAFAASGGTLPALPTVGGGGIIVPVEFDEGVSFGADADPGSDNTSPVIPDALWRRRAWSILKPDQ